MQEQKGKGDSLPFASTLLIAFTHHPFIISLIIILNYYSF